MSRTVACGRDRATRPCCEAVKGRSIVPSSNPTELPRRKRISRILASSGVRCTAPCTSDRVSPHSGRARPAERHSTVASYESRVLPPGGSCARSRRSACPDGCCTAGRNVSRSLGDTKESKESKSSARFICAASLTPSVGGSVENSGPQSALSSVSAEDRPYQPVSFEACS